MSETMTSDAEEVLGRVKWYDAGKGYGFVATDDGGGDVLLHANCLRRSNLATVADGARIRLTAFRGDRGRQAHIVLEVEQPATATAVVAASEPPKAAKPTEVLAQLTNASGWCAARIKWFDRAKGFGFANIFGDEADVFVHMELVRAAGLPDLAPGEAIAVRVADGPRGRMASEVCAWDAMPLVIAGDD